MQTSFIIQAIQIVHDAVIANESEIEKLDREIGDGDHYINLKRGCQQLLNLQAQIVDLPANQALQKIAMSVLSNVGGASGPLFASFFMAMAKRISAQSSLSEIAQAFDEGVDAIAQRGKSGLGEKTMLDVLIPVAKRFVQLAQAGHTSVEIAAQLPAVAQQGLQSTKPLLATKGRAAGLGERAIGHLDAGAKSCQVMIGSICDFIIDTPQGA